MSETSAVTTFLFTDIEGSTRLWEEKPQAMRAALARHDAIARSAVEEHGGRVVKMTGDGTHAVFGDPEDAVKAALAMELALGQPHAANGITLRLRCGIHAGVSERRDNDYFGSAVNRAARIMSAAHGGQVLLSEAVVLIIGEHPAGASLRDLGRIRLRDLASPERVFQLEHPQLRADFPPLRSLEAAPNNLPQQFTSFVGRETELAQACELLGNTRLLTLVGTGGLGKSRLALQVGAETLDRYPDGVWLVELAAIADERLVALAIATVLGLKEEGGRSIDDTLAKHVRDRQLLILLDNCEHLIDACARVAKRMLQAGAGVRILATSREPLRITGETTLPLPALALPDCGHGVTEASIRDVDAVRLFVERASAADPAFSLDDANAATVAEVCRRLDGIPLAVELAAARLRTMSIEGIAARLDDRFRLLTDGDRTALKRQQTLHALIDWSHDLLAPAERTLFRRLSVFAGGWTLEAAEAVGSAGVVTAGVAAADVATAGVAAADVATAGDAAAVGADVAEVDAADVLDLMTRLVEKSLVAQDSSLERYRYLETIRAYAAEELERAREGEAVRMRQVAYCVTLAEAASGHLRGTDRGPWIERLDAERENVLAAHRYCETGSGAAEPDMRLALAMRRYWFERGLLGLGYRITLEALARGAEPAPTAGPAPDSRSSAALRAALLNDAGQIAAHMGHYDEARAHLVESLAIAREGGDRKRIALLLQPLALACVGTGDLAAARGYLDEGLGLAREFGNPFEVAAALNALAQIARMEGDLATAEPLYRQVLELGRGRPDIESVSLLNLAMVAIGRGAPERARTLLVDTASICSAVASRPAEQSLIEVSAGLAASLGEWERALRYFGAAEREAALTGIHRDPTDEAFLAPLIARARAALAPELHANAETAGRALDRAVAIAEIRAWLAGDRRPETG